MMFRPPREGAPSWIKGSVSINPQRLIAFMRANHVHMSQNGWLSIDLKQSGNTGELYLELNTFKPQSQQSQQSQQPIQPQYGQQGQQAPAAMTPAMASQVRQAREGYNNSRASAPVASSVQWGNTGFESHYAPEINGAPVDEINPEDIPF